MRKVFILIVAASLILLIFSGCRLINGLLLGDDEAELIGLWQSSGWDNEEDYCYWDFRADGRVFVTEWTDDLETTLIPSHFNYSVDDSNILKLSQYLGIAKFEFEITDDSNVSEGDCYLRVDDYSSDFDFDRIDYSTTFHLIRRSEYSDE